jgi:transmembrane sensor
MENERLVYLLARKTAGESDPEEEKELELLLQQYPYATYITEVLMQPWKDVNQVHGPQEVNALLENHLARLEQAEPVKQRRLWPYAAIAASVALLAGVWMMWKPEKPAKQLAIAAPPVQKAPKQKIVLPDGSAVWLNAGSKLQYPEQFNKRERVVVLEGEAFFDIVKDADRPFMVKTEQFAVRVLGTTFDVRAYPQEDTAVAALVQGSIEVLLKGNEEQGIPLRPNEKLTIPVTHTTTIKNEQVTMPLVKAPLTTLRDSVVTETAWVQNKLAFKHMPLEQVARLMGQWYNADIRFKNESKKSLYFSGVFEKEDLEQALSALSLTTQSFHYSRDANGVIWIE